MYKDNFDMEKRLSGYPQKKDIGTEPSLYSPIWSRRRLKYYCAFGEEYGDDLLFTEIRDALRKYKQKKEKADIDYIVSTALCIVIDVMTLRDIVDEDIEEKVLYYNVKINYDCIPSLIRASFEVLTEFIDKYSLETFDDLAKDKLKELKDEIFSFFKISKAKKLRCKIFGHKLIIDEYAIYNSGKERCERCNNWKDEIEEL